MGSGVEAEFPNILNLESEDSPLNLRGELLAEIRPTIPGALHVRIVAENEDMFTDSTGRLFQNEASAQSGGRGSIEEEEVVIPEMIVGISKDGAYERYPNDANGMHQAFAYFDERMRAVQGEPGNMDSVPLTNILPPQDGWLYTELGRTASIGPPAIGSARTGTHSIHYSIGVPLSTSYNFLKYLNSNTRRHTGNQQQLNDARRNLNSALGFADAVAARFAHQKFFGMSAPPYIAQYAARYANIPDRHVQEVRGAAAVLYSLGAAAAHTSTYPGNAKDNAIALVRHNPNSLFGQLSPDARQWLTTNARNIIAGFDSTYSRDHPNQVRDYNQNMHYSQNMHYRSKLADQPSNVRLAIDDTFTVGDLISSGLVENYGKRTELKDTFTSTVVPIDNNGRIPLIVFEARYFGERNVSAEDFRTNHSALSTMAAEAQHNAAALMHPNEHVLRTVNGENQYLASQLALHPPVSGQSSRTHTHGSTQLYPPSTRRHQPGRTRGR
ncbi:hypothetical protein AB0I54_43885 [Streptomyces sp. NPDC050625]|uniref:hypothetical protein n=1 Tax=Streptomyces sp. NPDC050625 TaxID=3154629 RepID=UPI00342627D2